MSDLGGHYSGGFWIPDGYGYEGPATTPQENAQRQQQALSQGVSQWNQLGSDQDRMNFINNGQNANAVSGMIQNGLLNNQYINSTGGSGGGNGQLNQNYNRLNMANAMTNAQPNSNPSQFPTGPRPTLQQTGATMGGYMQQSQLPLRPVSSMPGYNQGQPISSSNMPGNMVPQNQSPMPQQKVGMQPQQGLGQLQSGGGNQQMMMMQRMQQIQRARQMMMQQRQQPQNQMMPQNMPMGKVGY